MADIAITPVQLVINTVGADVTDADGTAIAAAAANQFVVAAGGRSGDQLLLKFVDDGTGCNVVILAGDNPPAHRAGLGNLTIAMAASDVRVIAVEASRFLQDDGTIHITATDDGLTCRAWILPKGG